jgi:hypothetical protein
MGVTTAEGMMRTLDSPPCDEWDTSMAEGPLGRAGGREEEEGPASSLATDSCLVTGSMRWLMGREGGR